MIRPSIAVLSALLLLSGCARHFVTERSEGRIDAARSITSNSDTEWTVKREPAGQPRE